MRPAVLLCALLASGCFENAAAAPAPPRFTAWQEIVLLTVVKLRHAATHCGFAVESVQVDAFLASAGLGEADLAPRDLPPSLARQAAADADSYLDTRDAACAQAWDRYGPDGAPGIRNSLRR